MSQNRPRFGMTRREFGALGATAGAIVALDWSLPRLARAAGDVKASDLIPGKVPEMIVHNAKLGVMETPLELLRQHRVTPKEIMFNRLHFPISGERSWTASLEPVERPDWTITFDGLVSRIRRVTVADLEKMGTTEVETVVQCAGNGRAFFAAKAKCPGSQWQHGGMANVTFEGVPLKQLIEELNPGLGAQVRYITVNGADDPPTPKGADFEKSYRIDDPALDHAILAIRMNGEPIPACHGGPVRLLIPGFYGNMNVKYVTRVLFAAAQSPTVFQSRAYRVPLQPVEPGQMKISDFTITNSEPTYAFRIKSVIFAPLASDSVKAGKVTISGVAFNDGQAPITLVEVSTDGGRSWRAAAIEKPKSPFAWYHWSLEAELTAGTHTLVAKATDAWGRSQPLDGTVMWNPKGYEWNGADHVTVTVT